jgi:N6-L-threonylcarbamoyladenine synthase
MIILAIETSCDETAISILDCEKDTVNVLAHEINSQIEIHKEFGGVFPAMAKREHAKNCVPVLELALENAKLAVLDFTLTEEVENELKIMLERESALYEILIPFLKKNSKPIIDAIAVTEGPGLEPALWVGINFAKALSLAWNIPIVAVNHMEGHIVSALLTPCVIPAKARIQSENSALGSPGVPEDDRKYTIHDIEFPAISLLVSGGHTELVKIENIGNYEVVGRTRDDAVGEAFDKVARLLGYPYPGGPEISALAEKARSTNIEIRNKSTQNKKCTHDYILCRPRYSGDPAFAFEIQNNKIEIKLPRPMLHSHDLDFSFSGIKTAVLYMIQKIPALTEEIKMEIAKEFEDSVVEVLVAKTKTAIETFGAKTLIVGGGVIANKKLQKSLIESLPQTKVLIPNKNFTTDNATMIGVAGYLKINRSDKAYSTNLRAQGAMLLTKN